MPDDDRLSMQELAQILGTTYQQVYRKWKLGKIKPTTTVDGHILFSKQDAETILARKKEIFPGKPHKIEIKSTSGELASRSFSAFDAGNGPADIVIQESVLPEVAKRLFDDWSEMRCRLVLSKSDQMEIATMGFDGSYPVNSAAELIENLRLVSHSLKPKPCTRCGKGVRKICSTCAPVAGPAKERDEAAQVEKNGLREAEGASQSQS